MKTTIIVPVLNEAPRLPALFKALSPLAKEAQILFVDNGSDDGSLALITAFVAHRSNTKLLKESRKGFASPLNCGVAQADGEFLVFLDADALPASGWLNALQSVEADIIVGETKSSLPKKATPYGRLAVKLFHDHSKRTAQAKGHALPWGPTCNLGVKREWFERVGPFSPEAYSAFDIDWCWRAVLSGAKVAFAPKAIVLHERRNEREALLRQFDRYGLGEAWLHRTYSFLLAGDEATDPLLSAVEAFNRLCHHSEASKVKSLEKPLLEVAAAFSAGVRVGYESPYRSCGIEREAPRASVSWWSGKDEMSVFVPGKGITALTGGPLKIWRAHLEGASNEALEKLFQKIFHATADEAKHALPEFLSELSPISWVKI